MATDADASVGPIERGLTVLRALAAAPGGRSRPSDLTRLTGLPRASVDRIAATLVALGWLREEHGRELVLAPPAFAPALAYLEASRLPRELGAAAVELADELEESVSLAVGDGDAVRFVVQTPRRRALSVAFRVGDALPAERCAAGAVLAADWDDGRFTRWRERLRADPDDTGFPALPPGGRPKAAARLPERTAAARRDGWSSDDQLVEPGLVALAVPVRDRLGRTVAALSVASHTSRHSAETLRTATLAAVRERAAWMEGVLAAPPPPPSRPAQPAGRDASLDAKADLGPAYLQSLARGLAVLSALGTPGGTTIAEAAQATGLPRATARRALLTLCGNGYATADGDRFSPAPRVLDLGCALLSSLPTAQVAQPHLAQLAIRVLESASLAVLDGPDIRYTARVAARRIMHVDIAVGTRLPAHATAMGRVLLAGLDDDEAAERLSRAAPVALTGRTETDPGRLARLVRQARRDGYAIVEGELEEGLRSVAVPVRTPDGRVVAAVNVASHTGGATPEEFRDAVLPELRAAAGRIEADLALLRAFDAGH